MFFKIINMRKLAESLGWDYYDTRKYLKEKDAEMTPEQKRHYEEKRLAQIREEERELGVKIIK